MNWRRNVEPYQLYTDEVLVERGDLPGWMLEAPIVWRKQHREPRALQCLTINRVRELHRELEDIDDLRASGFIQQDKLVNAIYDELNFSDFFLPVTARAFI